MSDIYRQFNADHSVHMSDEYSLHSNRMTRESLHSKSEIALELAFRDWRINALESCIEEAQSRCQALIQESNRREDGIIWVLDAIKGENKP